MLPLVALLRGQGGRALGSTARVAAAACLHPAGKRPFASASNNDSDDDAASPKPPSSEQPPKQPGGSEQDKGAAKGGEVPPAAEQEKKEVDGPRGPEPTRYGDWERAGRCSDF